MNTFRSGRQARLDGIRKSRGAEACREAFRAQAEKDEREAALMLGDNGLSFGTWYILRPEIAGLLREEELSYRDRTALRFCSLASEPCKNPEENQPRFEAGEDARPVLLWMFKTGAADDGLSEAYDQTLDLAAAVLIRTYREESILPEAAELIFRRYRRGAYLHDLIWAYFKTRSTNALRIIARYLRSPVKKDVELARSLLHLSENDADGKTQYGNYLSWLKENEPYLYFTQESYQLTNAPSPCGVDLGAKFLCKEISHKSRRPLAPLTREEKERLSGFRQAEKEAQEALAQYSRRLHEDSPSRWDQWMQYPVGRQMELLGYGRRELV